LETLIHGSNIHLELGVQLVGKEEAGGQKIAQVKLLGRRRDY